MNAHRLPHRQTTTEIVGELEAIAKRLRGAPVKAGRRYVSQDDIAINAAEQRVLASMRRVDELRAEKWGAGK
ncbi:MAG: hypothetical protein J7500_15615 [Sphingomonas sp.]|uniref:hypothetical protein n=1 Tax=Sphingomonas sp. TaxID=28214 RepID=UPI001B1D055F|nr:hypothetical protein [Sphingomonas sp.]MBO9624135.1 hypothetical protein [Sphingomonas sp.]